MGIGNLTMYFGAEGSLGEASALCAKVRMEGYPQVRVLRLGWRHCQKLRMTLLESRGFFQVIEGDWSATKLGLATSNGLEALFGHR
jgi:hypothetical protein